MQLLAEHEQFAKVCLVCNETLIFIEICGTILRYTVSVIVDVQLANIVHFIVLLRVMKQSFDEHKMSVIDLYLVVIMQ